MHFGSRNFCSLDVAQENRAAMSAFWNLAKTSPKAAAERYGVDEGYAEKIARLSPECVEKTYNISQALFALRYRESQLFSGLQDVRAPTFSEQEVELIVRENRNALAIRWVSARQSVDECIDKFGLTRNFAETLAASSYPQLDHAAGVGHPLLKFNLPENVIDLVPQAKDSKELTAFMVLHD